MRIEYIAEGAIDCPLVLISGNEPDSIRELQHAIKALVSGTAKQIAIHDLPNFISIENCQLYAWVDAVDYGVLKAKSGDAVFVCILCIDSWQQAIDLLEPIAQHPPDLDTDYFNYLTNTGDINLIISTGRAW